MSRLLRVLVCLIAVAGASRVALGQKDLLQSVCPDCGVDLYQQNPIHGPFCKWSKVGIAERQLDELSEAYRQGRITADEFNRRHDVLFRAYQDAIQAEHEAKRAKMAAESAAYQKDWDQADKVGKLKNTVLESGRLQLMSAAALTANAEETRRLARQMAAGGDRLTARELESLARVFEDAAAGAAVREYWSENSNDADSDPWGARDSGYDTGYDSNSVSSWDFGGTGGYGVRDFDSEPLRFGDPYDAGRYIYDLSSKAINPIIAPASPVDVMQQSIYDEAPAMVGAVGGALNSVSGLQVIRDSLIDQVISRIPDYFEGQLRNLDETQAEQSILRSLRDGGAAPSSPSVLRDLTGVSPGPAASPSAGSGVLNGIRSLWAKTSARASKEESAPSSEAPATPKALRNLLDP